MPSQNQSVEIQIQQVFIARNLTLSLAESCTGGEMAAVLTRIPGCSKYFLGSLVAYSNDLKTNILGVDLEVLQSKGAVSKEVVSQMAKGIKALTNSDYAIAVSGVAGPAGGTQQKPVGTIWGAVADQEGNVYVREYHLHGSRQEIIHQSVELLLLQLMNIIRPLA